MVGKHAKNKEPELWFWVGLIAAVFVAYWIFKWSR